MKGLAWLYSGVEALVGRRHAGWSGCTARSSSVLTDPRWVRTLRAGPHAADSRTTYSKVTSREVLILEIPIIRVVHLIKLFTAGGLRRVEGVVDRPGSRDTGELSPLRY
ncbi:hypothetical protein RRG08_040737 [Elysia crispata]|uniref:Uncharacterized protein n=1 Tax=Elysia crispata TaxID=231223 RepID=A0AAE1BDR5_9GAST|nr:hypothetical protein RRG08_040737 [Elysia crispata]